MVLFYDDVAVKKTPPIGWRKYVRRAVKVTLISSLLLGVGLWGLSKAGGNSRALRLGIQDYMTDATGYIAEIDQLQNMRFFPVTHVEFTGLELHKPVKKNMTPEQREAARKRKKEENFMPQPDSFTDYYDSGEVSASVAALDIRMNFWDMFFTRRRFYVLNIKDIKANAGMWTPRAFHVEAAQLDAKANPPQVVAYGTYGDEKFNIAIQTELKGRGLYQMPDITPFTLTWGDVSAQGHVDSTPGNTVKLNLSDLEIGDQKFSGQGSYTAHRKYNEINATLKTGRSDFKIDLQVDDRNIKGTVTALTLDPDDLPAIRQAYRRLSALWGLPVQERIYFGPYHADVKLVVEKLLESAGDHSAGDLKAALKLEPYKLQLENILGVVKGGALSGDFLIDASTAGAAELSTALQWRGWDVAVQNTETRAQLDSFLALRAEGKTFAEMEKNLNGRLLTLGGAGVLNAQDALYWGSRGIEALLPKQAGSDLHLKCAVADFTVKGPQASAGTFFADFDELMLKGEGSIDILARTLNWTLTPQAVEQGMKGRAATLQVKGDMNTTRVSSGRQINLGSAPMAAKPVFTAGDTWPPEQLGLNSSHPCWPYLQQH